MNWTEPAGLYAKVLFQGSSSVWRHDHACLCFAPVRHCICFTVKLDLKTWGPRALKTAGQRCQRKQTRCRAHPCPGGIQGGWSLIHRFWFSPRDEGSQTRMSLLHCLFNISHHVLFFTLILVQRHHVASVRVPLRTYLYMNDCTLPIHLNSVSHITSALIWTTKCVFLYVLFSFFLSFWWLLTSQLLFHEFHLRCCNNRMDPVAEMTFPRSWPAFYLNEWKGFTAHFRTSVLINKTALN